jgi:Na+/H+-dicarboxylate symporter
MLLPIAWVLVALLAGGTLGLFAGPWVSALAPVAKLLIQLIKATATPLVFFATMEAVLRHQVRGQDFSKLLAVVFANASIAIAIGIVVANIFEPGQYLGFLRERHDVAALTAPDLATVLQKQVPGSVLQPFVENDILGTVALALLLAFAWRRIQRQNHSLAPLLSRGSEWIGAGREIAELVLSWVVKLVPLAVFAVAAKITHQHGLAPLRGLSQYVLLCLLGMALHLGFTYSLWLLLVARISIVRFWRLAVQPVFYAFGVNSSLVALPLTLHALDGLGISRRASTLTACIGTNLNNDGIILYEGFTLLALAQAFGLELSTGAQISAALYCVVTAMGVAGVPEAGVVALTLVLSTFGLPTEALAALLSVDWIIARCRSVLNVSSDMVGATVLQRWLKEADLTARPLAGGDAVALSRHE